MADDTNPLILSDGGLTSLLAVAAASDVWSRMASGQAGEVAGSPAVWIAVPDGAPGEARAKAAGMQAELFGLGFSQTHLEGGWKEEGRIPDNESAGRAPARSAGAPRGEERTPEGQVASHVLLSAAYLAVGQGRDRVVWPISAGRLGHDEEIDLNRASLAADRALLVSRLVALDSDEHGRPAILIEVPYVDLSDRQVAELAVDMDLPVHSCWWWGEPASAEAKRWLRVLRGVGWAGEGAATVR